MSPCRFEKVGCMVIGHMRKVATIRCGSSRQRNPDGFTWTCGLLVDCCETVAFSQVGSGCLDSMHGLSVPFWLQGLKHATSPHHLCLCEPARPAEPKVSDYVSVMTTIDVCQDNGMFRIFCEGRQNGKVCSPGAKQMSVFQSECPRFMMRIMKTSSIIIGLVSSEIPEFLMRVVLAVSSTVCKSCARN